MTTLRSIAVAAALTAISTTTVAAQAAEQLGVRRTNGIVTVNPFAVILAGFNGDVEFVTGPGFTVALSATYLNDDDGDFWDYRSVDLTGRYYPNEAAPRGFSVGAMVGYIDVESEECCDAAGGTLRRRETGPAFGFIAGYNWLLGRTDRLVIATGIGLKRAFVDDDDSDILPSGRLGVGLSF